MLRNTWKYAQGHRKNMFLFLFLSITANTIILFEPYVFGKILDVLQTGGEDMGRRIIFLLIILGTLPVLFWVFHGVSRIFESVFAYRVMGNYREAGLKALFGLPAEWHRGNHSGKNIDKLNRAALAFMDFSEEIFVLVEIIVTLVGSFFLLFFIKAYAGIAVLVAATLAFTFVILFDIVLFKYAKRLHSMYNKTASAIHDYLSNVITVLTMRFESAAVKESMRRHYVPFKLFKKKTIVNEIKWASVTFWITVMSISVISWEIFSTLKSDEVIVIGTLYTLYAYMDRIGHNFYQFAWKYSQIVEQDASVASAENIFRDYDKMGAKVNARAPKKWKNLRVEGLYFTYEDEKKIKHQIKNFSLDIPRGARIAFVGESGCGKSTVLGLLRGIFQASKGDLYVDGKKLPHGVLHLSNMTTLMPQEPEIFENTIEYNVSMGLKIPRKKILEVLGLARFKSVLKRLPAGLETNIAEKGVNLSGGEKQRLALARGLLAGEKSDILLMDEPTSSVDMENERAILKGVFRKYKDKTIIASVHRLSLLDMFDVVIRF